MLLPNESIGIFDSGIGGLSVLTALQKKAPHLSTLYFADTAHFPYGNKSPQAIYSYSLKICQFLKQQGAQYILCGCTTASSCGLFALEQQINLPIIGVIEPIVQHIAHTPSIQRIGVVATQTTARIQKHKELLNYYCPQVHVLTQACPQLAPLVEAGMKKSKQLLELTKIYVDPLIQGQIDTLLLGCTHYSFLSSYFSHHLPRHCRIIDPAAACVNELLDRFVSLRNCSKTLPSHHIYTSSSPTLFQKTYEKIFKQNAITITQVFI